MDRPKEKYLHPTLVAIVATGLFFLKLAGLLPHPKCGRPHRCPGKHGQCHRPFSSDSTASRVAAKPRDVDHPYGHGKAEFLLRAVEGALVILAGLIIIYEAIIDLSVLTLSRNSIKDLSRRLHAVINFIVGAICISRGKRNNSMALQGRRQNTSSRYLSTIGIIIVGLVLIWFSHLAWLDGVGLAHLRRHYPLTGYLSCRKKHRRIMDEADLQLLQEMIGYVTNISRENWVDLHNLRVIKYGRPRSRRLPSYGALVSQTSSRRTTKWMRFTDS